jgi:hypothetical protein
MFMNNITQDKGRTISIELNILPHTPVIKVYTAQTKPATVVDKRNFFQKWINWIKLQVRA